MTRGRHSPPEWWPQLFGNPTLPEKFIFLIVPDANGVAAMRNFIAPNMDEVRPTCPTCGTRMWLARLEADEPGYEQRTYECPECDHSITEVVKRR